MKKHMWDYSKNPTKAGELQLFTGYNYEDERVGDLTFEAGQRHISVELYVGVHSPSTPLGSHLEAPSWEIDQSWQGNSTITMIDKAFVKQIAIFQQVYCSM